MVYDFPFSSLMLCGKVTFVCNRFKWQRSQNFIFLQVSDIQARTALLMWSPPSSDTGEDTDKNEIPEVYTYEVMISSTGKDGKYKTVYM